MTSQSARRLHSVDALRGLVMLLLASNQAGGGSFFLMAEREPESAMWAALGRQFSHAHWQGVTVWDMVMPAFVFLVGVAIVLSYENRKHSANKDTDIYLHVVLRSAALTLLGLIILIPLDSRWDQFWSLVLLLPGVCLPGKYANLLGTSSVLWQQKILPFIWALLIIAAAVHVWFNAPRMGNYHLSQLLVQVGLAYPFAFLISRCSVRVQITTAIAILAAWWVAFAFFPIAEHAALPAQFGGFFAHWNPGNNFAAWFDSWFLNKLPRAEAYTFNAHGYQTLNCVPLISSIVAGSIAGRFISGQIDSRRIAMGFVAAGVALILVGQILNRWVCPIVKSIWTPSFVVFSTGVILVVFAIALVVVRESRIGWLAKCVVAAGCNSLLLYILSGPYRWWFVARLEGLFGAELFSSGIGPVLESVGVMGLTWCFALVLYRLKIFVRI